MIGSVVTSCRSCGSARLRTILDLGETPIANDLIEEAAVGEPEAVYPLLLVFCEECTLVQLGYELPADAIFGESYPYYSSFSASLCEHAADHVRQLIEHRGLNDQSLAVEVASNDGYLLRNFVEAGIRAVGIDPAPGPAAAAEVVGVPTIVGFFGVDAASSIVAEHGRAQVVIANNVMAHVPDLNDLVGGFAVLLADDGVLTIENPWVRAMVEQVEFDTVYHEHYCYFSCSAVDALMQRHNLFLNDIELFPELHGGTLRWSVGHHPERTERCQQFLDDEKADGLTSIEYYQDFSARVGQCQEQIRELVSALRAQGHVVAAYGAAAKGATLMNTTGIDHSMVSYVVDRNVHKQGKLMPGSRVPIRPVEILTELMPDDVILLAWNFADEIAEQQRDYLSRGGTFWIPVPEPRRLIADSAGRADT